MPVGEKALLEYLASGAIKGIGASTARRLLDVFGEDILTVIEEDPQQLTKVWASPPSGRRPSTSPSACSCPCAVCWTSSPPTACPPVHRHAPVPAVWGSGPERPPGPTPTS